MSGEGGRPGARNRCWQTRRFPLWLALAALPILVGLGLFFALRPTRSSQEASPTMSIPVPLPSPTPVGFGRLSSPPPTIKSAPPPLLDDGRLFYEPGWGTLEVRHFLESRPGTLARQSVWIGGQEMPLADIIVGKSLLYGLNPKVVLALIELQSGLVDSPDPPLEAFDWAMGRREWKDQGLEPQIDWAVRELFHATRDYPLVNSLTLSSGQTIPLPAGTNLGSYVVFRLVALTGDEAAVGRLQGTGAGSFIQTYKRLFGEDPRLPLAGLPAPAARPFLTQPYEGIYEVTAIFDHQGPFLSEDGSIISSLGEEAAGLPYDGHDGWDYALDAGVPILAAADGVVVWAGNSNDRCATAARGVVLEHGNGYQTLYWHLDTVEVVAGQRVSQGERIGLAGASGCAEGPHLHFGVHFLGRETDPEGWCGLGEDPWAIHPAGTGSRWLWADRISPCQWPASAVLADDRGQEFQRGGADWYESLGGVGGHTLWAPSKVGASPPADPGTLDGTREAAIWRPNLPTAGRYRVYAFIPYWNNDTPDSRLARYLVRHTGGDTWVTVDQSLYVSRWVELGSFSFPAGREGFVYLDNLTDEVGFCVWFDAALWVPE